MNLNCPCSSLSKAFYWLYRSLILLNTMICRMFLETVKRLRIMRTSDANGLSQPVHFGKVSSQSYNIVNQPLHIASQNPPTFLAN